MKGSPRILIVHGSPAVAQKLAGVLEPAGYQVTVASTVADALQQARAAKPDLVMVDGALAHHEGADLCQRLKNAAETAFVCTVLLSSADRRSGVRPGERPSGAVRWIGHSCQAVHGSDGAWLGERASNRDITQRTEDLRQLRQRTAQLEALRQVSLSLTAQLDLNTLLHPIISQVAALLEVKSGVLFLHRPDLDVLEWVVGVGLVRPGSRWEGRMEMTISRRRELAQEMGPAVARLRARAAPRSPRHTVFAAFAVSQRGVCCQICRLVV